MSEQSMAALEVGKPIRLARAQLRRDVLAGRVDWRTVILDPPACLSDMLLTEVLAMFVPGIRRANIETLGRRAFHAGLTLTTRARRSSSNTRQWLVATIPTVQTGPSSPSRARPRRHDRRSRMQP